MSFLHIWRVLLEVAFVTAAISAAAGQSVRAFPLSLSFGNQVVGAATSAQKITLKNEQVSAVTITSVATNLSDYTQTNNCPISPSTLAAGKSCTISVKFTPAVPGLRSGSLTISHNGSNSPQLVSLSGTGLVAVTATPSSLNFGSQVVGQKSSASTVTVTNNQTKSLAIRSIKTNLADFIDATNCPLSPKTLAAGRSCTVSVIFMPSVVGIATGTLTITDNASNSPQSVVLSGTGAAPTLLSIAVSPASASISAGNSQQFAATGTYSDGSTQNLTSSVSWASSATTIATITSNGMATAVAKGTTTIRAASGAVTGSATLTVASPVLVSLAITPANPAFALGTTQQLTATGTFSDGSTLELTSSVTWRTGDPGVATVNGQGLAASVALGTTTVVSTSGSVSGTTNLTVSAAALVSIAVTPAIPDIPLGARQQFTATGTFTDASTQDITKTVTWSSDTTTVATISNASNSEGLATSVATGSAKITASSALLKGTTTLTVTAAALVSLTVSPSNVSIPLGTDQQFTAMGTYTDGTSQDVTSTVTWSSDDVSVAMVNKTGLATSTEPGTANINASSGSISSSSGLTVTAAALVSISINPQTISVPLGTTQQFTAVGAFSDGSTQDLTSKGQWSSTVASVATISNSAGTYGLATTLATGATSIGISSNSVTTSATLSVTPAALVSITISPLTPNIALGASQQFTATGAYTDGSTQDVTGTVTWSSSPATVAVISNAVGTAGLATSAGGGTADITATSGSVTGSTTITVGQAGATSIVLSPNSSSVPLGLTQQFVATAQYIDGSTQDITQTAAWSSSAADVAMISPAGLATSLAVGTTLISATSAAVTGSTLLSVDPAAPTSLIVTPSNPSIAVGGQQQFAATLTYTDGSSQDATSNVSWVSSVPSVASISSHGLASGTSAGSTSVRAIWGSDALVANTVLTVSPTLSGSSLAASPMFGLIINKSTTSFPSVPFGIYRFWDSNLGGPPCNQWPCINTAAGTFNFSSLDAALAILHSQGINDAVYTLSRTPTWASSNPADSLCNYNTSGTGSTGPGQCDPPSDLNNDGSGTNLIWRNWVTNITQHVNDPVYLTTHAHIKYWEPWNEPYRSDVLLPTFTTKNYSFRGTYAQLLRLTEDLRCVLLGTGTIHNYPSAGTNTNCDSSYTGLPGPIDGTAKVVMSSAGTSSGPIGVMKNFLYCNNNPSAVTYCNYGTAGAASVDIINIHEKPGAQTSTTNFESGFVTRISNVKAALQAAEQAKPLWDGEGGYGHDWTQGYNYSDSDMQASFVPRYLLELWSNGIAHVSWYTWDIGNFLWTSTDSATKAAQAWQTAYRWMVGSSLTTPCSVSGSIWTCGIQLAGGSLAEAIWDNSQTCSSGVCTTSTQSVDCKFSSYADVYGATEPISACTVAVGIKPILLLP